MPLSPEKNLCDHLHEHPDLCHLHSLMPDDDRLFDLADLFRVFGDSTRIRILYALYEGELCVCDLAQLPWSRPIIPRSFCCPPG